MMNEPRMWWIFWMDGHKERHWGTLVPDGPLLHITHYSGGVGGGPRPMNERVVRLDLIKEWRSDD